MWFLLKYQGYPPAIFVALLLHSVILYFIIGESNSTVDFVDVEKQVYVSAIVTEENPQRLRRLENLRIQRDVQQARDDAAREDRRRQQQADDRAAAADAARQEENRQRIAAEQAQQETDRINRENAIRNQQEQDRIARAEQSRRQEEQTRIAQQQADAAAESQRARQIEAQRQAQELSTENQLVQAYSSEVRQAVMANWSIPPSARNGMIVSVSLRLVPTGEVISIDIVDSSGDAAFDRSALQAIRKVGRFYELEGIPIAVFERNFRNFNIQFSPEDLLR